MQENKLVQIQSLITKKNNNKMSKEALILKIGVSLTSNGLKQTVRELNVKETDKSFVGDGSRISKDKIMKIDTIFVENHRMINYYTYCMPEDKDKAIEMLKSHVKSKVMTYKSEIDALFVAYGKNIN